MSKTVVISDKMYDRLIDLSIKQTDPEKSDEEYFNAMDFYGQYDDAFDGGVETGEIELAKELVNDMRNEAERQ